MSFKIGNVDIKGKVILAPMAGITSFSYRKFMKQFNPSLEYTEMVSDCGLIYGNNTTFTYLKTDGSDSPLSVQIFGGETKELLNAIDIIEKYGVIYEILDLNLACPVPKVVKNNGGSSWLKDQDKLYDMVSQIVKKSKKPVSCKVRLGFNSINIEETVKTLEKAGVKFIAIHARTKKDGYTGKANYEALRNIHKIINIPFAVSGDINTVEDAKYALDITKANAVMVARGAVGNPELIVNINKSLNDEEYSETFDKNLQFQYLKEYVELLVEEYGEKRAIAVLKGIAPKFFVHIPNSKELRVNLAQKICNKEDIYHFCTDFINKD